MNIQQIEYVLAVTKFKNFGRAAEECCITQSTLSTMIAKLEQEIGIQIFDRKTKPVSITNEGLSLIYQLKNISKEISAFDDLILSIKGELHGEIRIACIPTVAPYIFPLFLNEFTKNFPNIRFSISEMTTDSITELLLNRELDIGILAIPLEIEGLNDIKLYEEPFVLYDCSGDTVTDNVSIESLNFDKFWLLNEGHCLHTQVRRICDIDMRKKNSGINFDFRAGSIDSLIRFVKKNKGITMLPYLAALEFAEDDLAKTSLFSAPAPSRTIGLVIHKHFSKKKILDALKSEIYAKILPRISSTDCLHIKRS